MDSFWQDVWAGSVALSSLLVGVPCCSRKTLWCSVPGQGKWSSGRARKDTPPQAESTRGLALASASLSRA